MKNKIFALFFIIIIVFILFIYFKNIIDFYYEDYGVEEKIVKNYKVCYVSSYHEEYSSEIDQREAFRTGFIDSNVLIKYFFLDAKREKDKKTIERNASKIRKDILKYKPDYIVFADDIAVSEILIPYFLNQDIPCVFIGVNWNVSKKVLKAYNTYGQIEKDFIVKLFYIIQKYFKCNKTGYISGDNYTDKKSYKVYTEKLKIDFCSNYFVKDFDDWKKYMLKLNSSCDSIFFRSNAGIKGWNKTEAITFIEKNINIPVFSVTSNVVEYSLFTFSKLTSEFGDYAAKTISNLINNRKINNRFTENKKYKLILNMRYASEYKEQIPYHIIDISEIKNNKIKDQIKDIDSNSLE